VALFIGTAQVGAEPEQAPVQPENVLPAAGVAVSVTRAPLVNDWLHPALLLQLIPAGLELTVPEPPTVTCRESVWTIVVKDAPTLWAAVSVIAQLVALPEHTPVQPTNVLPEVGAAVNVTVVPLVND
jgi:hypothetical protein